METIGKRLEHYLEKESVSVKEFAEQIGIHTTSAYRMIAEDRGMNSNTLVKIIEFYPNLNINWLLTGIGTYKNALGRDTVAEESTHYSDNDNLKNRVKEILNNEVVLETFIEILKKYDK